MTAEEEQTSMVASMRKSHTMRKSKTSLRSSLRNSRVAKDDDDYKIN